MEIVAFPCHFNKKKFCASMPISESSPMHLSLDYHFQGRSTK